MSRLTRIGFEFGLLKRLTSSVTKSTSGYVPIFGYKSDSLWRNPLLRERRNAQYHLMSLCLAPFYLGEYNLLVIIIIMYFFQFQCSTRNFISQLSVGLIHLLQLLSC